MRTQPDFETITAVQVERTALDTKSSGDMRKRVDAYFVSYCCPPDDVNPGPFTHEWICRFEVPRGTKFEMRNFPTKAAAKAARGFTI